MGFSYRRAISEPSVKRTVSRRSPEHRVQRSQIWGPIWVLFGMLGIWSQAWPKSRHWMYGSVIVPRSLHVRSLRRSPLVDSIRNRRVGLVGWASFSFLFVDPEHGWSGIYPSLAVEGSSLPRGNVFLVLDASFVAFISQATWLVDSTEKPALAFLWSQETVGERVEDFWT